MLNSQDFNHSNRPPISKVVDMTSQIHEALQTESFFSPEGYNLSDPVDARLYLTEIHGRDLPKTRGEIDASTGFHLARAMQREHRAAIYEKGVHQNVAEHSFNLAVTSTWVAQAERPDLDASKVTTMAAFHDLAVEAYGGDTQLFDEKAMSNKRYREAASMTLFLNDVGDSPLGGLMKEYREGRSKEARFVKGMDKVEAYQLSLDTQAVLHRVREEDFVTLVEQALPEAAIDHTADRKMQDVLKYLGRKWMEWGCKPFEGNPDEIVSNVARYIIDRGADLIRLPVVQQQITPENAPLAQLKHFPVRALFEVVSASDRRIVEPALLRQLGVAVIGKAQPPDRPTPPSPPQSAFALAA